MMQFIPLQNSSLFIPFELEESDVLQLLSVCPILHRCNTWNKTKPSYTTQFLLLSLYDSYNLSPYRMDTYCFSLPSIPSAFFYLVYCLLDFGNLISCGSGVGALTSPLAHRTEEAMPSSTSQ